MWLLEVSGVLWRAIPRLSRLNSALRRRENTGGESLPHAAVHFRAIRTQPSWIRCARRCLLTLPCTSGEPSISFCPLKAEYGDAPSLLSFPHPSAENRLSPLPPAFRIHSHPSLHLRTTPLPFFELLTIPPLFLPASYDSPSPPSNASSPTLTPSSS